MDFNTPNPTPNPNPMPNQGIPTSAAGKKTNVLVLIILAIAVVGLMVAAYVYMQKGAEDYFPEYMTSEKAGDRMMAGDKTESTDAGPEIMLNKDTTSDIQKDLDGTMTEDVDQQFTDIDKDLQGL